MVLKSHLICLDVSSNQSQNCSDNQQFWSENVQCPTTISSTDMCTHMSIHMSQM